MTDSRNAPARVLVVDDDRLIRELVRDSIRDLAVVECLDSAERALEALARAPADLVICDLHMAGLSGLELLERIRREHPGTDFVLLTGNATLESAIDALRKGATDYLTKPIQSEELALLVERTLAGRRLLAENERLQDELRTLEACRSLLRCLEPGEVYAVSLDLVLHGLPCRRGLAQFRRTGLPGAEGLAFRGFDEGLVGLLREKIAAKPLDAGDDRAPRIVSDGGLLALLREAGVSASRALVVPLRGSDTEMGVLWLLEDEVPLDEGCLPRVKLVAAHAELALSNAERYHRAKERAFLDDVTEAYNARFLLQATEHEIQRADRYGKELSVLFLDLDRFKLVNDRHGHLVGSEVLRRLSRVLQECIRQVDTLARYGGDEFTILLVDTGGADAMAIAERIRRTVAETLFEGGDTPIRLTISIGVATYPHHARDRDGLLDAADKAMYRAKSRGRNCCCSAADLD